MSGAQGGEKFDWNADPKEQIDLVWLHQNEVQGLNMMLIPWTTANDRPKTRRVSAHLMNFEGLKQRAA